MKNAIELLNFYKKVIITVFHFKTQKIIFFSFYCMSNWYYVFYPFFNVFRVCDYFPHARQFDKSWHCFEKGWNGWFMENQTAKVPWKPSSRIVKADIDLVFQNWCFQTYPVLGFPGFFNLYFYTSIFYRWAVARQRLQFIVILLSKVKKFIMF